jgi:hypothetical protein
MDVVGLPKTFLYFILIGLAMELGFTETRNDRLYTGDMKNLGRLDEWHFLTPDAYMYTQQMSRLWLAHKAVM